MINLIMYWCICGILMLIYINLPQTEEKQKRIQELVAILPLSIEQVKLLCSIIVMVLGGVILPLCMILRVYEFMTGRELL